MFSTNCLVFEKKKGFHGMPFLRRVYAQLVIILLVFKVTRSILNPFNVISILKSASTH